MSEFQLCAQTFYIIIIIDPPAIAGDTDVLVALQFCRSPSILQKPKTKNLKTKNKEQRTKSKAPSTTFPMSALVECVPNFSEGRNRETVSRIADAIAAVDSSCILDTHIDPDHNRSVITFVASAERVVDAAVSAVAKASQLIDMRLHSGEHPRLGATDVLPFVPIKGVSLDDCAVLAHEAGQRIANELSIPSLLFMNAQQNALKRVAPRRGCSPLHEGACRGWEALATALKAGIDNSFGRRQQCWDRRRV